VTGGNLTAVAFLAMGSQKQRPGITWKALAATEEGGLTFPGSALLEEEHYDEGEGWGFDAVQLSAMLNRRYAVEADPDEVMAWFDEQLRQRGWQPRGGMNFKPGDMGHAFYSREASHFTLRVFGRAGDRPWWTFWRRSWSGPELHYDITLSEASAEDP
jgi:hypothetical protein